MIFWPFWLGGIALAAVAITHYLVFGSHLAVSGRMTVLVNRFRERLAGEDTASDEDMAAMLRAMTAAEFGDAALEPVAAAPSPAEPECEPAVTFTTRDHVLFFGGLALGGLSSSMVAGTFRLNPTLRGDLFGELVGTGPRALATLFLGGALVGFGTRMGGGCTSGHGLVGVSRLSKSSLVATACFFGAGIGSSLVMEVIR